MSYKQENQLGAKNKANFDVFQNPDVKLVFKIDVKRIQWGLNVSVSKIAMHAIWFSAFIVRCWFECCSSF